MRLDEFRLHGFDSVIIQRKLELEGTIRDPPTLPEEVYYAVEYLVKFHALLFPCLGRCQRRLVPVLSRSLLVYIPQIDTYYNEDRNVV